MPDDFPTGSGFPHLQLLRRDIRPARFPPGFSSDQRVSENRRNRGTHAARLRRSVEEILTDYHRRSEERREAGLPAIESGIPFVVEVPEGYDLDELISRFKIEVVAEDETEGTSGIHRYVLVSSQRIEDSELLRLIHWK